MTSQKPKPFDFESRGSAGSPAPLPTMARLAHRLRILFLALCALALSAGAALAQGAADGFDPNVNGTVFAVVVQSSGKIIIGGNFTSVNGTTRNNLARLNPDGTLDTGFTTQADAAVTTLALQANGSILLGGVFNAVGGQTRHNLARLTAGGTLDSFNPDANGPVAALAVQQDGKILVGGSFTTMGNLSAQRIARLQTNGELDANFVASMNDGSVTDMDIEPDGQIVVGGTFTSVNGQTRNHLVRLSHGGGVDQNFNPNVNGIVDTVRVLPGGRIVFGGNFTSVGGQTRNRLARLNDDGSLDAGFNPNLNFSAATIALQPNGDMLVGGNFTTVDGLARNHIARFHFDGSLDSTFVVGINDTVSAIAVQPDNSIVIGGSFTAVSLQTHNRLARLYPAGTLDNDLTATTDGVVNAVAIQADGKILIGGDFTTVGGQPRNRIARLNVDGSVDGTFNPNANGTVQAIAVQSDGKILVGGLFAIIGGGFHSALARLNTNGTLDATFAGGANDRVYAIALQPDGKVIVGGDFTSVGGVTRNHIARFDANGGLDGSFAPNINGTVRALALQSNGQVVIGGGFTTVAGAARNFIARLNGAFGTVDSQFNPGAGNQVHALAILSTGEIMVGGAFTTLGGQTHNRVGRLSSGGAADAGFTLSANDIVSCFAETMHGRILAGGDFTQFGGQARNRLARFNYDGTMDSLDTLITGTTVNALAMQMDGKIVIGGSFSLIGGQVRGNIGRYHANEFVSQKLTVNNIGTQIDWTFIGAAPSFDRVEFELSTNGVDFSPLVAATSVSGGWRATGLSLQPLVNFFVRARGTYATGLANGSGSVAEAVTAAYLIPCFFNVTPTAATYGPGGGTFMLDVIAFNQACSWSVQSNAAWITPASFSGIGSQSVGYALAANPGGQRVGTMTVAGQTVTITQLGQSCANITINPSSIPAGTMGQPYNVTLMPVGSAAPYQFTLFGSLPAGLSLNQSTGVISGTPTVSGLFQFQVGVHDLGCGEGLRAYNLTINSGGGGNAGLQFYPLPHPLRLLDTRPGASGCDAPNAKILAGTSRTQLARRTCDNITIPATAMAVTGNITTVQSGGGYLTLYPSDVAQPIVANSNYNPNEVLNNVFTVGLGAADGAFKIFVTSNTDVVVDVTGYYAPPAAGGLYFHPLPKPIRLLDTRAGAAGAFAPSSPLQANADTPQQGWVSYDGVTIPNSAMALVGNATTVNNGSGYLTLYPGNVARPLAASSNFSAGQVMNAPFTVGLSAFGEFMIYTSAQTDLVVDVLGYYSADANDANGVGLLFNPLPQPVRLLDTRAGAGGCYTPNAALAAGSTRQQQARGACGGQTIANSALAIVGNATVVNDQAGYLTFWPNGAAQPLVATTNFSAGQILNRHFTVGLGATGMFNIFASAQTDLIVDVSGFFAP